MQNNKLHNNENMEITFALCFKKCLLFLPVFLLTVLICTTIIALIFYNTDDPSYYSKLSATLSLYVSFIISVLIFIRRLNEKKILFGFICGTEILLILYSVSILTDSISSATDHIIRISIPLLGSALGMMLSKVKSKSKKRRKRHL